MDLKVNFSDFIEYSRLSNKSNNYFKYSFDVKTFLSYSLSLDSIINCTATSLKKFLKALVSLNFTDLNQSWYIKKL